jgi:hypothetical protein
MSAAFSDTSDIFAAILYTLGGIHSGCRFTALKPLLIAQTQGGTQATVLTAHNR